MTTDPADEVLTATLDKLLPAILCGAVKPYTLPAVIHAVMAMRFARVKEDAGRRAEELHAVKMAELKGQQAAALEGVTAATQLTPEQVAEIRQKVLGL